MHITYLCENIFNLDKQKYVLAHCVATDLGMGAGIAKIFREKYGGVDYLKSQHPKVGGLCHQADESSLQLLVYLTTKLRSRDVPTLANIRSSLVELKDLMLEHKYTELAIPTIACGLDRQSWVNIEKMLRDVFRSTSINITVCYLPAGKEILNGFV
ncbi:Macro domain, Poa1p_like family [Salmon gill poxvirus]